MYNYIDESGTAFDQMGVDVRVEAMVNALLSLALASYGICADFIVPGYFGRQ